MIVLGMNSLRVQQRKAEERTLVILVMQQFKAQLLMDSAAWAHCVSKPDSLCVVEKAQHPK